MLSKCINYGNISGVEYSGGIVGYSDYTNTDIKYCVNSGCVAGKYAGGIIGETRGGASYINSCYTTKTSNIKPLSAGGASGGIVGSQYGDLIIYNSGNLGEVEAINRARRNCGDVNK